MRNIQELMNAPLKEQPVSAEKQTKENESLNLQKPTKLTIRRLWERMISRYGHSWRSIYGELPEDPQGNPTLAGDTWARDLAGVTQQQIAVGIQESGIHCREYPPSSSKFRALCLGVISFATVKDQLINGGRPHPFTRMVSSKLDWFLYKRADTNNANVLLREAYDASYEAVLRGEKLPVEPIASLSVAKERKFNPAPPEVVEKHLNMIREILA